MQHKPTAGDVALIAFVWAAVIAILLVREKFVQLFAAVGMALPPFTAFFLNIPAYVFFVAGGLMTALVIGRAKTKTTRTLAAAMIVVFIGWSVILLFLPLVGTFRGIGPRSVSAPSGR